MFPMKAFIFLLFMCGIFVQVKLISLEPNDENGYTFTMPKALWSGRNEMACLTLYGKRINSAVKVSVHVTSKHTNGSITNKMFDAAHMECFEVAVPKTTDYEANVNLEIEFLTQPSYKVNSVEKVSIAQHTDLTFIQTDRNIYKPGDLVQIRILFYNNDLSALKDSVIPIVRITSPLRIVIAQWSNVKTELGLVQLEHQLSDETTLGPWTIELPGQIGASKSFEVKEYTLPRFDVKIERAPQLFAKAKSYKFKVCSTYTYGAPLRGTARLEVQLGYGQGTLLPKTKNLTNGCAEFAYSGQAFEKSYYFNIDATVTEQGSGEIEKATNSVYLSYSSYYLTISPSYFQPGIPYVGKVKVDGNYEEMTDKSVKVCFALAFGLPSVSNFSKRRCQNFTLTDNKDVDFVIFPYRENIHSIQITAELGNKTTQDLTVNRWYSPSDSYILISHNSSKTPVKCGIQHPFTVLYTVNKEAAQNSTMQFYYLIKSKGNIIKFSKVENAPSDIEPFNKAKYENVFDVKIQPNVILKQFVLPVDIDQKMYSEAELLVFYVHQNGEVVSNKIKFDVENCFANKVEAGWTESQKYPGESTSFNIKAASGSLCAVSAVDKSTDILSPGLNLNTEVLLRDVQKPYYSPYNPNPRCKEPQDISGYDYDDIDSETRTMRYSNPPFYDTAELLDEMQLLVMTNLATVTKPCIANQPWSRPHPRPVYGMSFGAAAQELAYDAAPGAGGFASTTAKMGANRHTSDSGNMGAPVRSYFPETWLFDLVAVGQTGEKQYTREIPHTITQWIGNTFCVSPTAGIGVAPTSYITSFKPFFVDLLAPYAIKRNEVSHLKVIAFNYLNHTIPIKVTIDLNENLKLADSPNTFTACLAPSDSVTNVFKVTALVDGKMNISVTAEVDPNHSENCVPAKLETARDAIIKNILVQVEGFPLEDSNSSYICLNENSTEADKNIRWDLALPANAVPNYSRINILLDGDLMELTVENIGTLLQIPTGCGEQIMATLAPNLYVLRYLQTLNKLKTEVKDKSISYIKTGYEKILRYRHIDGSFSVFGEGNTESSMFLTAFVLRTLAQSSKHVYIDDQVIQDATKWILKEQNSMGCFPPSLNLYSYDRKEGRDDTAIITAYVLISLIEAQINVPQQVLDNAKLCISGDNSTDKYRMAIVTYALTLVGATEEANRNFDRLLKVANREKGQIWWQDAFSTAKSVETTAYVILALLASNNREHVAVASGAVKWLLTKRNYAGGFISTQDTVVALDALSRFALVYKTDNVNLAVTIKTDKDQYDYKITNEMVPKNKQLSVKEFSSFVDFKIEGTGCILLQNTLRYNMPIIKNSDELKLDMNVLPVLRNNKCQFANISLCVAYTVVNKSIDMAVLELALPSGYKADKISLNNLITSESAIKRYEEKDDKVILYYNKLGSTSVCGSFLIYEQSIIENRTSSIVRIYDYYNPIVYSSASYQIPPCQIVPEKDLS